MSLETFLNRLGALKLKWFLHAGAIRTAVGGRDTCPIVAVARGKGCDWWAERPGLGLRKRSAANIANASDVVIHLRLRRRILKACKLKESTGAKA